MKQFYQTSKTEDKVTDLTEICAGRPLKKWSGQHLNRGLCKIIQI